MKYAGLTIADKDALLDAQAKGDICAWKKSNGYVESSSKFPTWKTDGKVIPINTALAQIAEMEREQKPAAVIPVSEKPLTWNDAINAMSAEEKALLFDRFGMCYGEGISDEECNKNKDCYSCAMRFLNSPYDGRAQEGAEG